MESNVGYSYETQPSGQAQQTTVVIQQPQAVAVVQNSREWAHGICGCFDDLGECMSDLLIIIVRR